MIKQNTFRYNLIDNETEEHIYSTNDKQKHDKYIDSN